MRRLLTVLAALALLLAACGDDDGAVTVGDEPATSTNTTASTTTTTTTEPEPERPAYTGGYELDPETGEVDVSAYQAFLAEHGAPEGGAEAAALELLGGAFEVGPTVTSEPADGGRTVVVVLAEGLADDSVEAERFELVFVADGDALILESGSWASRCQPGRGHDDFATGRCA